MIDVGVRRRRRSTRSERGELHAAFAAVRGRLGLVAAVAGHCRRLVVVDGRSDGRNGCRSWHRSRGARLVLGRLGGDDGGDDVSVAGADGRALRQDDAPARIGAAHSCSPVATWSSGEPPAPWPTACFSSGGACSAAIWPGIAAGGGVAGGVLALAAVYEMTPLKDVCLAKCRSPLGFLLGTWRDGRRGAFEMGARHAGWCLGCCWALMAALFALGVMSLTWMVFVAALIALEKTVPWRRVVTWGTAGVLLALALAVVAAPQQRSRTRGAERERRHARHESDDRRKMTVGVGLRRGLSPPFPPARRSVMD